MQGGKLKKEEPGAAALQDAFNNLGSSFSPWYAHPDAAEFIRRPFQHDGLDATVCQGADAVPSLTALIAQPTQCLVNRITHLRER